jgi:hypothetical protein
MLRLLCLLFLPLTIALTAPAYAAVQPQLTVVQSGQVGVPYNEQLVAPISGVWSVTGGSLPPGLTLSVTGDLSGTPTGGGTFSFTVSVAGLVTLSYQIVVAPPVMQTQPPALPAATIGAPYNQTLIETGGTPPYTWSVSSGSLPAGLSLSSSGQLSGTPTATGVAAFVVQAVDSSTGTGPYPNLQGYSLPVNPVNVSILPTSLPAGTGETPYPTQNFSVIGGAGSPTFTATGLPAGLSLTPAGTLSGTPSVAGSFPVVVTASELAGAITVAQDYLLTILSPVSLSPNSMPAAAVGTAYAQALVAVGGIAPYTYSVTAGTLPAGLSLNSATGQLSGLPTATGLAAFTATAKDVGGFTASRSYTLPVVSTLVSISPSTLPLARYGQAFSQPLSATPSGLYTFAIAGGALPAGLSLSPFGVLSGTPHAAGSFGFGVAVSPAGTNVVVGWQPYRLVVAPPPTNLSGPLAVPVGRYATLHGTALPHAVVQLFAAYPGHRFSRVAQATTTSTGGFSFTRRITAPAVFEALAAGRLSRKVVVGTNPTLTGPAHVAPNNPARLSGVARPGTVVSVYAATPGHALRLVGHPTANRTTGGYSITVTVTHPVTTYVAIANSLRSRTLVVRSP